MQVSVCGGFKSLYLDANCNNPDKVVLNFSNISFIRRPSSCIYFKNVGKSQNKWPNQRQCALSNGTDSPVSDSISFLETKFSDIVSRLSESASGTFSIGEDFLNKLSDSVTLSLTTTLKNTNQAVEYSINETISFINKSAGSKLGGLPSELKEASNRAGPFALDVLRGTIVVVENSFVKGGETLGYAYSFLKESLPPEVQEALGLSEEIVGKVLNPAGTVFQQVRVGRNVDCFLLNMIL